MECTKNMQLACLPSSIIVVSRTVCIPLVPKVKDSTVTDGPPQAVELARAWDGPKEKGTCMFTQAELIPLNCCTRLSLHRPSSAAHPLTNNGITNQMDLITLEDGTRLVLRRYQWPWEAPDLDRPQKEEYVHALLRQAGVPVPAILAHIERAGQSSALMEFMFGENLGDIAPSLPEKVSRWAWRSCGSALRLAHTISYPKGTYGIIVGDHIRSFAEVGSWEERTPTWGHSQIHMILDHFQQLCTHMPHIELVDQEVRETLAESLPYLNRTPPPPSPAQ